MTPLEDFADRLARVRSEMKARGHSTLALFFNGQHYMLRYNPIMHLSDFKPLGLALLVIPQDEDPISLISPEWDLERARQDSQIRTIAAAAPSSFVEAAAQVAQSFAQPLAVAGLAAMTVDFGRRLTSSLEPFESADDLLEPLAVSRSELELERVTRAAGIADEGFRCLTEAARVGMKEYELAAEIECAMQSAGSDDNYGLLGAGRHNLAVRAPGDRRLEAGDLVIGEITPCFRGSFAQLCRTLVLGEPTDLQRRTYDMLIRAEDAGLAAIEPGRPAGLVAQAVNAVISAAGYAEYCRQPYMRTRGHGLGFGGVIPANLTEGADELLVKNMTMVVHPNQYLPETGYMMLGDTIVVEESGARKLTKTPVRLFSKAA